VYNKGSNMPSRDGRKSFELLLTLLLEQIISHFNRLTFCQQQWCNLTVIRLYVCGRLLLWDCDGRCYSYYVDVSNNQQNWTRVVNKTTEACRSWQTIFFDRQPVTFIRIVGTHNTANEVQLHSWFSAFLFSTMLMYWPTFGMA